jgi:hypothetical protein
MRNKIIRLSLILFAILAVAFVLAEPERLTYNVNTNDGLLRFLRNPIFPSSIKVTGTATFSGDATVGDDLTVTDDATIGGDLAVTGSVTSTAGVQSSSVGVATAIEATQSPIPAGTAFATITSGGATEVVVLPVGVPGNVIRITVLATGAELQTLATGSATINAVDCSGANEMAMAAGSVYVLTCTAAETWVAYGWGADGAAQATIVPDADA